ncbi:hypothetical protein KGA66_23225 [Actinocrinis puniceicyclus]|uniref:Guanylate cyclase domain-containing protein n=1 Tax=Actinocrinis puniceicyclus TaxID=977794 RepID=A0A8J8BD98_9ACTN|nr:hypothetical protein [Actinocrinis puniceicyclus]MBS2965977.1 hypothetical protein [Actinocrinis puniceicyclus]
MPEPLYCAIAVVDIEGFGKRNDTDQGTLRRDLHAALAEALGAEGVDWSALDPKDTGDGAILRIPASVPKTAITRALSWKLHTALVRRCLAEVPVEEMRVRVALHGGEITEDEIGLRGTDLNTASRLVDAQQLRDVLAAAARSHVAVIVSDAWYRAVVRHGYEGIAAESFAPVRISIKELRETAWVTVPGLSTPPGLPPFEPDQAPSAPTGVAPAGSAAQAPAAPGSRSLVIHGPVQEVTQGDKNIKNIYGGFGPNAAVR